MASLTGDAVIGGRLNDGASARNVRDQVIGLASCVKRRSRHRCNSDGRRSVRGGGCGDLRRDGWDTLARRRCGDERREDASDGVVHRGGGEDANDALAVDNLRE